MGVQRRFSATGVLATSEGVVGVREMGVGGIAVGWLAVGIPLTAPTMNTMLKHNNQRNVEIAMNGMKISFVYWV